jgi:hypothetical protein
MGIRVPLPPGASSAGFDRVVVIGVKTTLDAPSTATQLAALLEAHHYTGGLAFLPQGTPTNNLAGSPAAYPPPDPNGQRSFGVERGAPLDTASDGAAAAAGAALGLAAGVFAHVDGADLRETAAAHQMNRVLFSATLGYYFDQILTPLVGRDAVDAIGRHFVSWVVPRGPVPALRVGRVPYGVLPVTSLERWQPADAAPAIERQMAKLLLQLRGTWLAAAAQAPHIGRGADADQDLLDILSMDASARQVRVRRVIGDAAYLNLAQLFNWSPSAWASAKQTTGRAALNTIGLDPAAHPRVAGLNYADQSWTYHGPLVDIVPSSESSALEYNYVSWVQSATLDALRQEAVPSDWPADVRRALLYRFLRHSALAEYHWWVGPLVARYATPGTTTVVASWSEPELVGLAPGTEARATPWQRLDAQVQLPGGAPATIATLLDRDDEQLRALTGVGDFRDALAALAPLPTAELERLFTESLDAASYRLDAWITALANQRLSGMQAARGAGATGGCFIGAYGWLENLRPAATGAIPAGGYIQAPSMAHAMTAAVLRNAYLTNAGEDGSPYAVDLSSAQVRSGRFVLDSVRNGQPAGAVFGYLLERALHERQVEMLIDPIRRVAPLVANKLEDSGPPADTVAARNVVDGLALRTKWKAQQLFDVPGGLIGIPHRDVLEQELANLDRSVDAVADLLLAESVHQTVRGNTMAGAAGLDALAQGTRPPDPDVARTPVGGTTLTHRVAVLLPSAVPASSGDGWPATRSVRAACEPRLDAWMASLLRCRVQYAGPGGATQTIDVAFDALGLSATDVVALAPAVATAPAASELDRRVLHAAMPQGVPPDATGASFTIVYAADAAWDRATTRTVPELMDLANAIGWAVGGMRPLAPLDLVLPETSERAGDAQVTDAEDEAAERVQAAVMALASVVASLRQAVDAVPAAGAPTAAQEGALRDALTQAAGFGVAAAFPAFPGGLQEGGVSPLPLLDQARSVLAELDQRSSDAAGTPDDPVARTRAIFGRDFTLLSGFTWPSSSPAGAELGQALAYGPSMLSGAPDAVEQWFAQASRVREPLGRARLLNVLARATGAAWPSWRLAQLPHVPGASWIGRPPRPAETRTSGTLSLALQSPLAGAGVGAAGDTAYGLFLDEWVEVIPDDRQHTGVAFHHPDTGAEAPQTILVAVPPTTGATWDFDALLAIIDETLDLAKLRAVDLEQLDPLAQIIPAIFLAANAGDETISTSLGGIRDPVIVAAVED